MELQKGICFLCYNERVISFSEAAKAFEIICTLFSKKIVNILEFNNIQTSLELCPICYHELIMLKRLKKNIEECMDKSEGKCFMCKHGEVLFKINDWHYFEEISEDLDFNSDTYLTCSDCIFYLHTRNELKAKLISKYPQLNSRTQNVITAKQKVKSKNITRAFVQPRLAEKKRLRNFTNVFNICPEEKKLSKRHININSIKKFKPLKRSKILSVRRIVQTDPKLYNQIPYVLLKVVNTSYDREKIYDRTRLRIKSPHIKCDGIPSSKPKTIDISEAKETKTVRQTMKSTSNIKTDLNTSFIKNLIVKLSRMDMSKKLQIQVFRSNENQSNTDKLNDKFIDIQNADEVCILESSLECSNISQEREVCSKTKRKSVSFAEDKNVEIEYFQKEMTQNINNDNNLESLSANRDDLQISKIDHKSNTEKNSETEKLVAEITDDNVGEVKESGVCISGEQIDETVEKVNSKDFIEQNQAKMDNDKNKISRKSSGYKPKPLSKKKKSKITDDLDSRSETMDKESDEVSKNKRESTASCDTAQIMRKENNDFSNNEDSRHSSDILQVSLSDHLFSKDQRSNTYEQIEKNKKNENECINKSNLLSKHNTTNNLEFSIDKKKEDDDLSISEYDKSNATKNEEKSNTSLDDKKNVFDSESTELYCESEIIPDTNDSQLQDIGFNSGSGDLSDNDSIDNTKKESENQTDSIINDELEHFDQSNNKESNKSDENINENNKFHTDSCKITESVDTSSFSDSEKNDDLEMTEDDKNNINSILSGLIMQQDHLDDTVFENKEESSQFENEGTAENTEVNYSTKRKSEEISSNTEKKKKRVTFCEDVT